MIGLIYFLCSAVQNIYTDFNPTDMENIGMLQLPVLCLDTIFCFWIFQGLINTLDDLRSKHQTSKLSTFISLRNVLIVTVSASLIYCVIYLFCFSSLTPIEQWSYTWFVNYGVWDIMFAMVTISVMVLWRPSKNARAYVHHVQLPVEERQV